MSPLNRLYFSVYIGIFIRLSLYGNFFRDLLNDFSIFSISPFLYGYQSETACSMCVRTNDLYNRTMYVKVMLK